jgi:hypothetical protein
LVYFFLTNTSSFDHHFTFSPTLEAPRTTFYEALIELHMDCHGS